MDDYSVYNVIRHINNTTKNGARVKPINTIIHDKGIYHIDTHTVLQKLTAEGKIKKKNGRYKIIKSF